MDRKTAKAGAVVAILMLNLCVISSSLAQNQSQDNVKQKIDCVLCKILNLITLIAIPLTLIVIVPFLLLGFVASIISRDKWKKAQAGSKEKRNAKWIMTISIVFTALMVSAILLAGILLLTTVFMGDCGQVCGTAWQPAS